MYDVTLVKGSHQSHSNLSSLSLSWQLHRMMFCIAFQGVAGTAISKEASDVILLNDDFNSIVNAIKWGRHIYYTVLKFLQFQFTVSWVAVVVVIVGACLVGVRVFSLFHVKPACHVASV